MYVRLEDVTQISMIIVEDTVFVISEFFRKYNNNGINTWINILALCGSYFVILSCGRETVKLSFYKCIYLYLPYGFSFQRKYDASGLY